MRLAPWGLCCAALALGCAVGPPRAVRLAELESGVEHDRLRLEGFSRRIADVLPDASPESAPAGGAEWPYYLREYTTFPEVGDAHRLALVPALIAELERAGVTSFEYQGSAGAVTHSPPWTPAGFESVPVAVLFAAQYAAARRGAELDTRVPLLGGGARWVTVEHDLDGRLRVRDAGDPAPASVAAGAAELLGLRQRYGIGELTSWTEGELVSLARALSLLSPPELAQIADLPFRRASRPSRRLPKGACGLYTVENAERAISIYDCAFEGDALGFVGRVQEPERPSVFIILHEIGHALSHAPLFSLQRELLSLTADLNAHVKSFNRLGRHVTVDELARLEKAKGSLDRLTGELNRLGPRLGAQVDARAPALRAFARVPGAQSGLTPYGRASGLGETFAEAFALYRVDPAACRRISPEVLAFFESGGHLAP